MYRRCKHCNAVNLKDSLHCKRCGGELKYTNNLSLAFGIAGLFFYIPANIYPILISKKLAKVYSSTIIDGIFALWSEGDYPIAIIVFLASVLIPLIKFLIIFYLLYSIKFKKCEFYKFKVSLYSFISVSGHWSLLDVFVVVVLTGIVSFKMMSVLPGSGALYFLIMVILTILSVKYLDLRELGEKCAKSKES